MKNFVLILLWSLSMISVQAIAIEPATPPPFGDEAPILEDPPFPIDPPIPESPIKAAVKVSIGSIGGPIDDAAIRTVRQVVGHAVATGTVGVFVVTSPRDDGPIPIEGGLSFCAETGFNVFESSFNEFVDELKSIQPQDGTVYNIRLADRCPVIIEEDDDVACTEDAKICPDGTGVGRVPPSCEFAPCPGDEPMPPSDDPTEPMLPVDEPMPPVEEPVPPSDDPVSQVEEPVPPTDDPVSQVEEPVPPTDDPVSQVEEPVPPTDDPVSTVEEPVPPTDDPMSTVEELVPPTDDPVSTVEEPVPPTGEPIPVEEEPMPPSGGPIDQVVKPMDQNEAPIEQNEDQINQGASINSGR